ncbi:2'-5' RNA ligase family protein [Dongshaea marina]|uniref:2'-5' RNA ligase family protein n=1 Tax=Dongshaea marina TaxID=2047966 RepID=UPI000D3E2A6C|nr:2'-5' RNA ligase family protein [Dongshaea marina]
MDQAFEAIKLNFEQIEKSHAEKLAQGYIAVDPWLQRQSEDNRIGLTLLFHVGAQLQSYPSICSDYKPFEDYLYLYPQGDLHITLFDIFPAVSGFSISSDALNQYRKAMVELFREIAPFQIDLEGVLFTDSAGLMKGFDGLKLHQIRTAIREKLTALKLLYQERFESRIAHITFCRFKDELTQPLKLLQLNQKLRNQPLGSLQITEVDLVIHDYYNLSHKTEIIATIPLGGKEKTAPQTRPIPITTT